ncbi:MAG: Xaa-Pro peptidase family protein [Rikenellaceae bacterium]
MYTKSFENELSLRWDRVAQIMSKNGVEALIVSDNISLYYLSGRVFSGVAYFAVGYKPLFFVRRPVALSGDNVVYIRKVEDIPTALQERGYPLPKSVALEGDVVTFNEYSRLQKVFSLGSSSILSSATSILRYARSVKTEYEISKIRESAQKHTELYSQIKTIFKRGMTDNDLAIEMEYAARKLGSVGNMRIFGRSMEIFVGSILVGENAASPSPYDFALGGGGMDSSLPIGCNGTPIVDGTTVMVDQGGNFGSYITDMTRVFALGEISPLARHAHNISIEMHQTMIQMVKCGVATADIYNMCVDIAKRESLSQYFMGDSQKAPFVGHGVGLEINETPVMAPRSREVFEQGNVFAFEPKFVIPKVGAVGVENTYLLGASGVEKLTIFEEEIINLE